MFNPYQTMDRSSAANINEIRSEKVSLDLTVNFNTSVIEGEVTHTFVAVASDVTTIHLDIEHINVESVKYSGGSNNLKIKVQDWPWITDEEKQVLTIYLDKSLNRGETIEIVIKYKTKPDGLGLNWLGPSQTLSKKPFFYTECQTYYCRSLAPLQDTPFVKSHFSSRIRVPGDMIALSSGTLKNVSDENNSKVFEFKQKNPIPSYLMAVVVGVLEKKEINSRTFIYAEKDIMKESYELLKPIGSFLDTVRFLGDSRRNHI